MTDTLRFYQDPFRDTRWRVEAPNGEPTLASTEGYVKASDALANAQRYLLLSPTDDPNVWTVHTTEEVNAIIEDLGTTTAELITAQPGERLPELPASAYPPGAVDLPPVETEAQ